MKRKMILKRITSFVCAMMVLIGAVGGAVPYKASNEIELNVFLSACGLPVFDNYNPTYGYLVAKDRAYNVVKLYEIVDYPYVDNYGSHYSYIDSKGLLTLTFQVGNYYEINMNDEDVTWKKYPHGSLSGGLVFGSQPLDEVTCFFYSGFDIYTDDSYTTTVECPYIIYDFGVVPSVPIPDDEEPLDDIGFLSDFAHLISYKRGSMYNYNMDSRTDRWAFNRYSTSGVDLALGGYSVRHYVRPVLVNGYDDEDVVEKYDKFYDASYDTLSGYIQYLDKDLEGKLAEQGYEGPSWFDKYILGRFVLRWHYFELIDSETGQSNGFARLRPKDADSVNGGTEYWVDYVDENDNIIEGTDGDVAYRGEGSYVESEDEDIEDAFDDAEEDVVEQEEHESIFNLEGVDILSGVIQSFSASMGDFASVISNFFNCLPPWVLTVFGLSVSLTFLGFIIKNLR